MGTLRVTDDNSSPRSFSDVLPHFILCTSCHKYCLLQDNRSRRLVVCLLLSSPLNQGL